MITLIKLSSPRMLLFCNYNIFYLNNLFWWCHELFFFFFFLCFSLISSSPLFFLPPCSIYVGKDIAFTFTLPILFHYIVLTYEIVTFLWLKIQNHVMLYYCKHEMFFCWFLRSLYVCFFLILFKLSSYLKSNLKLFAN